MKLLKAIKTFTGCILIVPIRIYQWIISPILPVSCRHVPSCSEYSIQAIKKHGAFKGGWLGFRRLLRCHPWGTHGYDPVPEDYSIIVFKKYKL